MERKILNPIWDNEERTRIRCDFEYTVNNTVRTVRATISNETDENGNQNPDWQEVINTFPEEEIEGNTKHRIARIAEERQIRRQNEQRMIDRKIQEELFEAKLKIFQINEVLESDNIEAKSAIRKSKSIEEVHVRTIQLLVNDAIIKLKQELGVSNTNVESSE